MQRPPALATFLDYCGDLAAFPGLEGMVEAVVVRRRLNTPAQTTEQQAFYDNCVALWVGGLPTPLDGWIGGADAVTQAVVTAFAWVAECYADPAVATRFEQAIPAEILVEHLEWANERKARTTS